MLDPHDERFLAALATGDQVAIYEPDPDGGCSSVVVISGRDDDYKLEHETFGYVGVFASLEAAAAAVDQALTWSFDP